MSLVSVTPCTLLDFPDTPAAIFFFGGCNLRCGYCHNPEMVLPERRPPVSLSEEACLSFLKQRHGLLEGVVLCGGEPTLYPNLLPFVEKIKSLGYKIKLDTNGTRPDILQTLLSKQLIDYVAMDFKCTAPLMETLCKGQRWQDAVEKSLSILRHADIACEIRTTVVREIHTPHVLLEMAKEASGIPHWYLQAFRPEITLDASYSGFGTYTHQEFHQLIPVLAQVSGSEVLLRT